MPRLCGRGVATDPGRWRARAGTGAGEDPATGAAGVSGSSAGASRSAVCAAGGAGGWFGGDLAVAFTRVPGGGVPRPSDREAPPSGRRGIGDFGGVRPALGSRAFAGRCRRRVFRAGLPWAPACAVSYGPSPVRASGAVRSCSPVALGTGLGFRFGPSAGSAFRLRGERRRRPAVFSEKGGGAGSVPAPLAARSCTGGLGFGSGSRPGSLRVHQRGSCDAAHYPGPRRITRLGSRSGRGASDSVIASVDGITGLWGS